MVAFYGKDIRFCIGTAYYHYGARKKIEGSSSRFLRGKMSILPLVSTKPLESNIDMALVSVDGPSHFHLSLSLDTKDWTDFLPWTCSNILHNISLDKKNFKWWSHVVFCDFSCCNTLEDVWAYPSATYCYWLNVGKDGCSWAMSQEMGSKKKKRYLSDLTQESQKYPCKVCGDRGHYASTCRKPQGTSVKMEEFEKGYQNIFLNYNLSRS